MAHQRPDLDLFPILAEADAYLDVRAPRLPNGAIAHWGEAISLFESDQVWIDSLFMFGMYWLRRHDGDGDRHWLERLADQLEAFAAYCRDPATDLWFHAYDASDDVTIPADPVFWARGNSWVLVAAVELLSRLDEADPLWERVAPMFRAHASAIAPLQAGDGLWLTVLNDPFPDDDRNYTETSGSALITWALGRGVDAGLLEAATYEPVVSRGIEGVLGRLFDDGDALVLSGTSLGTNPGSYENYVRIATFDDYLLGVGAVVVLLAEVDGRPVATVP